MRAGFIESPMNAYFKEVEEPQIIKDTDVKVRVKFTGICGSEIHAYHGEHLYRIPPLVSGHEFSGIVEEVGTAVTTCKPGDRVTAEPHAGCGVCSFCRNGDYNVCPEKKVLGATYWSGSFGEFVVLPQETIVKLPDSVSLEQGALIEPIAVGMHALRISPVSEESTILIIGAGPIGLGILLCALGGKHKKIMIAARRKKYLDIAKEMGCEYVIDTSKEDLVGKVHELTDGVGTDVTFLGYADEEVMEQAAMCTKGRGFVSVVALLPSGTGFPYGRLFQKELTFKGSNMYTREDFELVVEAMKAGKMKTDQMITAVYPIEKVKEALAFVDERIHPVVKVLLSF